MSIVPAQFTTYTNTGTSTVTLTCPNGVAALGDLLIACVGDGFSGTSVDISAVPGGWIPIGSPPYKLTSSNASIAAGCYYRITDGTDVAGTTNYVWTIGGTHKGVGIIKNYKQCWINLDNNGGDESANQGSNTTAAALPVLTTHGEQDMVVGFITGQNNGSGNTNNSTTIPTGWTKGVDIQTTATSSRNTIMCDMHQQLSGPSTPSTAITLVNATWYISFQFAIVPQSTELNPPSIKLVSVARSSFF